MAQLTKEDVERLLGRGTVDDRTILAILATDANAEELTAAYSRTMTDLPLHEELTPIANARVSQLCEILEEIAEAWADEPAAR